MPALSDQLCGCGCGQRTHLRRGLAARFRNGHNRRSARKSLRWTPEDRGFSTPCWIWRLALDANGYGSVARGPTHTSAHRAVYEERRGALPEGTELDHLCRVRDCVNPDHMDVVSHEVNCQRGRSTKLSPDEVRAIRRLAAAGTPQVDLAEAFGVSFSNVSMIVLRRTWRNV